MKLIVKSLIVSVLFLTPVFANAESQKTTVENNVFAEKELRVLLNKYTNFGAQFVQEVKDSDEQLLHTAKGQLQFKQPGQFRWQVIQPEPELLLSDGTTLWWHNPFVEQVTIFDAEDAVATTPFALLVSQDDEVWSNFVIGKITNGFEIKPKDENAQVSSLVVTFANDVLQGIDVTSRSQRISQYALTGQVFDLPASVSFEFEIPPGTEIDDQRSEAQQLISDGNVQF